MASANTDMRMAYLTTERGGLIAAGAAGGQLTVVSPGVYTVKHAHNGFVAQNSVNLATMKTYLAPVDPTIVNAV